MHRSCEHVCDLKIFKQHVGLQEREDASLLTPRQLTGQPSDLAQLLSSPSLAGSAAAESAAAPLTASLLHSSRSTEAASSSVQVHAPPLPLSGPVVPPDQQCVAPEPALELATRHCMPAHQAQHTIIAKLGQGVSIMLHTGHAFGCLQQLFTAEPVASCLGWHAKGSVSKGESAKTHDSGLALLELSHTESSLRWLQWHYLLYAPSVLSTLYDNCLCCSLLPARFSLRPSTARWLMLG